MRSACTQAVANNSPCPCSSAPKSNIFVARSFNLRPSLLRSANRLSVSKANHFVQTEYPKVDYLADAEQVVVSSLRNHAEGSIQPLGLASDGDFESAIVQDTDLLITNGSPSSSYDRWVGGHSVRNGHRSQSGTSSRSRIPHKVELTTEVEDNGLSVRDTPSTSDDNLESGLRSDVQLSTEVRGLSQLIHDTPSTSNDNLESGLRSEEIQLTTEVREPSQLIHDTPSTSYDSLNSWVAGPSIRRGSSQSGRLGGHNRQGGGPARASPLQTGKVHRPGASTLHARPLPPTSAQLPSSQAGHARPAGSSQSRKQMRVGPAPQSAAQAAQQVARARQSMPQTLARAPLSQGVHASTPHAPHASHHTTEAHAYRPHDVQASHPPPPSRRTGRSAFAPRNFYPSVSATSDMDLESLVEQYGQQHSPPDPYGSISSVSSMSSMSSMDSLDNYSSHWRGAPQPSTSRNLTQDPGQPHLTSRPGMGGGKTRGGSGRTPLDLLEAPYIPGSGHWGKSVYRHYKSGRLDNAVHFCCKIPSHTGVLYLHYSPDWQHWYSKPFRKLKTVDGGYMLMVELELDPSNPGPKRSSGSSRSGGDSRSSRGSGQSRGSISDGSRSGTSSDSRGGISSDSRDSIGSDSRGSISGGGRGSTSEATRSGTSSDSRGGISSDSRDSIGSDSRGSISGGGRGSTSEATMGSSSGAGRGSSSAGNSGSIRGGISSGGGGLADSATPIMWFSVSTKSAQGGRQRRQLGRKGAQPLFSPGLFWLPLLEDGCTGSHDDSSLGSCIGGSPQLCTTNSVSSSITNSDSLSLSKGDSQHGECNGQALKGVPHETVSSCSCKLEDSRSSSSNRSHSSGKASNSSNSSSDSSTGITSSDSSTGITSSVSSAGSSSHSNGQDSNSSKSSNASSSRTSSTGINSSIGSVSSSNSNCGSRASSTHGTLVGTGDSWSLAGGKGSGGAQKPLSQVALSSSLARVAQPSWYPTRLLSRPAVLVTDLHTASLCSCCHPSQPSGHVGNATGEVGSTRRRKGGTREGASNSSGHEGNSIEGASKSSGHAGSNIEGASNSSGHAGSNIEGAINSSGHKGSNLGEVSNNSVDLCPTDRELCAFHSTWAASQQLHGSLSVYSSNKELHAFQEEWQRKQGGLHSPDVLVLASGTHIWYHSDSAGWIEDTLWSDILQQEANWSYDIAAAAATSVVERFERLAASDRAKKAAAQGAVDAAETVVTQAAIEASKAGAEASTASAEASAGGRLSSGAGALSAAAIPKTAAAAAKTAVGTEARAGAVGKKSSQKSVGGLVRSQMGSSSASHLSLAAGSAHGPEAEHDCEDCVYLAEDDEQELSQLRVRLIVPGGPSVASIVQRELELELHDLASLSRPMDVSWRLVLHSHAEPEECPLGDCSAIDIVPEAAGVEGALRYLIARFGLNPDAVVACGEEMATQLAVNSSLVKATLIPAPATNSLAGDSQTAGPGGRQLVDSKQTVGGGHVAASVDVKWIAEYGHRVGYNRSRVVAGGDSKAAVTPSTGPGSMLEGLGQLGFC